MQNMLAIVERAACDAGGGPVTVVHLKIGEMAGVSVDALRFAFEVLSPGTVAEGGTLEVERVPLVVGCARCGARSHPDDLVFRCGECGAPEIEILGGREMEVDYILVGEDDAKGRDGGACAGGAAPHS
jgi:hydrogenase nickel incorporation protein HypA/HybF